jgi:hypothetical protein
MRALLLGMVLAPCAAFAASGCDDLSGLPINVNAKWPQVWQALNDQAPCTQNCHLGSEPTAELDLSSQIISIYFLVGQLSSQNNSALRVDPGNPRNSLFFQKVNCSQPDVGGPMPPPNGHLSIALQGLIYDWIEQGAYGESSEDPIARDYLFRSSMESLRF